MSYGVRTVRESQYGTEGGLVWYLGSTARLSVAYPYCRDCRLDMVSATRRRVQTLVCSCLITEANTTVSRDVCLLWRRLRPRASINVSLEPFRAARVNCSLELLKNANFHFIELSAFLTLLRFPSTTFSANGNMFTYHPLLEPTEDVH